MNAVVALMLTLLATFHEDRGPEYAEAKAEQAAMVTSAVVHAVENVKGWQGSKHELAAILLTIAWHESTLSLRIHRGQCRPMECDRGRARSPWQLQRQRGMTDEEWELLQGFDDERTRFAAVTAARHVVRSRALCRSLERHADWVALTLAAYAGRRCTGHLPDMPRRLKTFRRLAGASSAS